MIGRPEFLEVTGTSMHFADPMEQFIPAYEPLNWNTALLPSRLAKAYNSLSSFVIYSQDKDHEHL